MPNIKPHYMCAGCLVGVVFACFSLTACGDDARLPEEATTGPSPTLPEPRKNIIPTIKVAKATGWANGERPRPAHGFAINAFARDLDHPRWLYVLPNGDVLVAETNAPERPEEGKGVKGAIFQLAQKRAGAGVKSADRITLLRDADGDGVAEIRSVFLDQLHSPIGMALIGSDLFVANTDAVLRFPYKDGATKIDGKGEKVAGLPAGPLNHHWTKTLVASPDGTRLYVGVGSNSNAGENGLDREKDRALILEIEVASGKSRVFASGLRNPVGMAWEPSSGELWAVVNERDELGSDLVPDYLTSVKDGGFYGWPFSYWGQNIDTRVEPQNAELVSKAIVPDYALGNHVAPLGLAFAVGDLLPEAFRNGAFVGEHGSWNRTPFSGYKVVFVPFENGRPSGKPVDVITGFLDDKSQARGRPVSVVLDHESSLLVADDVGNTVWRAKAPAAGSS